MNRSQPISRCRKALRYVGRRRHLTTAHAVGSPAHHQDEREARIARYAAQVDRYQRKTGRHWLNGARTGSKSYAPKAVLAMTFEGIEIARFASVRAAADYVRLAGLSRSPRASVSSTIRKALRRGFSSYGLVFAPIAA